MGVASAVLSSPSNTCEGVEASGGGRRESATKGLVERDVNETALTDKCIMIAPSLLSDPPTSRSMIKRG